MIANLGKFQYMLLGQHKRLKQNLEQILLESAKLNKTLGISTDHNLTFDTHISNIYMTADAKIKSLSRIRNAL